MQALLVEANFRFVKSTSAYFSANDDLFNLVGSSLLKSATDKLSNKIILHLTTSKLNLLTSIVDKNNYQSLRIHYSQDSKVAEKSELKNHSSSLYYNNALSSRTIRVSDYSTLVNFLNDFSFLKTTKRINVLSRTS